MICAFAVLNHITKPENPFMYERDYLNVDEFGVDEAYCRQGIATEMICFNQDALEFYEAVGFTAYRSYMEMNV